MYIVKYGGDDIFEGNITECLLYIESNLSDMNEGELVTITIECV